MKQKGECESGSNKLSNSLAKKKSSKVRPVKLTTESAAACGHGASTTGDNPPGRSRKTSEKKRIAAKASESTFERPPESVSEAQATGSKKKFGKLVSKSVDALPPKLPASELGDKGSRELDAAWKESSLSVGTKSPSKTRKSRLLLRKFSNSFLSKVATSVGSVCLQRLIVIF